MNFKACRKLLSVQVNGLKNLKSEPMADLMTVGEVHFLIGNRTCGGKGHVKAGQMSCEVFRCVLVRFSKLVLLFETNFV